MRTNNTSQRDIDRREFLSHVGKGVGLAAMSFSSIMSLLNEVRAATSKIEHLSATAVASDEDYWAEIQRAFIANRTLLNLNNGAVSPSPRVVVEALQRYEWQQEDVPPYTMWQILAPQVESVRKGLAELFGCDPEEIAITRNASEGMETLLLGIDLKPGDEILTTTIDYPRMLQTLRQMERRNGTVSKVITVPTPPKSLDELVKAFEWGISSRTKVILVSHISFANGQIFPVREICELGRSKNIEVFVDGAHSFAQLDFRLKDIGCHYFATSLHKWLHAPKGTGMLYVKKDRIQHIWPLMAADEKLDPNIRKFEEIGTHSAAVRLAIGEAILFYQSIGPSRKEARLRYLSRYWMNKVKRVPNIRFSTSFDDNQSCALTCVGIEGLEPEKLSGWLFSEHNIVVTPMILKEFQAIRVTPNIYTTLNDLDRFCSALETAAKKGLPR
jgi:selenocysteine lyase/cysteine desulfurase